MGLADPEAAARSLIESGEAQVVIVKQGGKGALIATPEGIDRIPYRRTERVWKLGSGDVFSATFSALWGANSVPPRYPATPRPGTSPMFFDTSVKVRLWVQEIFTERLKWGRKADPLDKAAEGLLPDPSVNKVRDKS